MYINWPLYFRGGNDFTVAGRGIRRLASLTARVEDFVNESDRHACLDDGDAEFTREYVLAELLLYCPDIFYRQDRIFKAYNELLRYQPSLWKVFESEGDMRRLMNIYKDVKLFSGFLSATNTLTFHSLIKVLMPLVLMIRPASSELLFNGSCLKNRSQIHRSIQMTRTGEDSIMTSLVITFAPLTMIGMIPSESLSISNLKYCWLEWLR